MIQIGGVIFVLWIFKSGNFFSGPSSIIAKVRLRIFIQGFDPMFDHLSFWSIQLLCWRTDRKSYSKKFSSAGNKKFSDALPSTSPAMAVCTSYGDLSLLVKCSQLPLQAWFTSFRNGLLPNRNRFTDFKQLRTGSRKSIHRFTQPLLARQITKVIISKQCEKSWPFKANHMRNSLRKFRMMCPREDHDK